MPFTTPNAPVFVSQIVSLLPVSGESEPSFKSAKVGFVIDGVKFPKVPVASLTFGINPIACSLPPNE